MTENKKQIKSKERVVNHGEVYTPEHIVNDMLDLVKQETERIGSRFLEPACGNGNFLAEILRRKLKMVKDKYKKSPYEYEIHAVEAVTSIYGVELLQDNVDECIERLFQIFDKEYTENCKKEAKDECREVARYILKRNILCGDALTLKTADNEPIIFSQWSLAGNEIKREDYSFDEMLHGHEDQITFFMHGWKNDEEIQAFIPRPVREFNKIHYLKVREYEKN